MRTGLTSDSRRTRQQVGLQKFALSVKARFNPCRDSAGCTIVMRWQRRLKSYFVMTKRLSLKPGQGTVHVFCEHLSPVDESACNPKPKSLRQAERNPFHVGHNELANYSFQDDWPYLGPMRRNNLSATSV